MDVTISSPADVIQLIKNYARKRQEHFGVICVDSGKKVVGKKVLFIGGTSRCNVFQKIIFWYACEKKASGIIVFHNHPCGVDCPSEEDFKTTEALNKGCDIMGIQLLDHMIISRNGYYSFLENGKIDSDNKSLTAAES